MSDLTIFIVPAGPTENIKRLKESFKDIDVIFKLLEDADVSKEQYKVKTKWFGYLFSDEYLQTSLQEAIPVFLRHAKEDCLTIMRRKTEGHPEFSQAPRLFRKHVTLVGMQPKSSTEITFNRILDGFILG